MKNVFRTGIAQLELILVLVVLLPLFLGLVATGMFGTALSSVTVSARHDAWRERQTVRPKVFEFDDTTLGRIRQTRSAAVKLAPIFDKWSPATSTSIVYGGSWDHRASELQLNNASPNRSLAFRLIGETPGAKLGELDAKLDRLRELADLQNLPSKALSPGGFLFNLKSIAFENLKKQLIQSVFGLLVEYVDLISMKRVPRFGIW